MDNVCALESGQALDPLWAWAPPTPPYNTFAPTLCARGRSNGLPLASPGSSKVQWQA